MMTKIKKWLLAYFGFQDWKTVDEFEHPGNLHKIDGTTESVPIKWRDQVCTRTDRIRRQSNFGYGWATEWEDKFEFAPARIVHVVAWWNSGASAGFHWFYSAESADKAFEEEKSFVDDISPTTIAYRFDVSVIATDSADITDEIDSQLDELCEKATIRYQKKHAILK